MWTCTDCYDFPLFMATGIGAEEFRIIPTFKYPASVPLFWFYIIGVITVTHLISYSYNKK